MSVRTHTNDPTPLRWRLPSHLAHRLGVHYSTVIRWCASGRIRAWHTPGGRWNIPAEVCEQLVREAESIAQD